MKGEPCVNLKEERKIKKVSKEEEKKIRSKEGAMKERQGK